MSLEGGINAIVIGGSIGGLSCAHALLHAGCRVQVFERSSRISPAGAGLGLDPEACGVLQGFGLGERLARVTGEVHTEVDFAVDVRAESGGPPVISHALIRDPRFLHRCAHWSDIHKLLYKALPAGVMNLGHQVVGFQQQAGADRVTVTVSTPPCDTGGTEVVQSYEADLLVAADGNMSETRKALFPDDRRCYRGYCAWRGVLDGNAFPQEYAALKRAVPETGSCNLFFLGARTHAVLYELPDKRVNWMWYQNQEEPNLAGRSLTIQASEADVAGMRAGAPLFWPPALATVMQVTPDPFINAIYDRDPINRWVAGRVVLAGEAAHPSTPHASHATNMAILDAAALGQALASSPHDIDAALHQYQSMRVPVAKREVLFSRHLGRVKQGLVPDFPAMGSWALATEEELQRMPMSQILDGGKADFFWQLEGQAREEKIQ